jgi:hypothetical protein
MGLALGCAFQFYGSVIAMKAGQANSGFAFGAYAAFWFRSVPRFFHSFLLIFGSSLTRLCFLSQSCYDLHASPGTIFLLPFP